MCVFPDNLSEALEKLKLASTDSATDSVESCLDCLLKALANNSEQSFDFSFDTPLIQLCYSFPEVVIMYTDLSVVCVEVLLP